MARKAQDMDREDIKAAIRKTGLTLEALALRNGYCASAVRAALIRPWPAVEAIIARHLNRSPQTIWPSRYDDSGLPLRGLRAAGRKSTRGRALPHRQKRNSA